RSKTALLVKRTAAVAAQQIDREHIGLGGGSETAEIEIPRFNISRRRRTGSGGSSATARSREQLNRGAADGPVPVRRSDVEEPNHRHPACCARAASGHAAAAPPSSATKSLVGHCSPWAFARVSVARRSATGVLLHSRYRGSGIFLN